VAVSARKLRSGTLLFRARLLRAVPDDATVFLAAALWGLAMALSAMLAIRQVGWSPSNRQAAVVAIFGIGGAISYVPAALLARFAALGRPWNVRFAASLCALGIVTLGLTALLYATLYRFYYSQWHAETLTLRWAFELIFTTAGALYQFAVLGLRMYFPLGFAALAGFALWWARTMR
jgi:hypothetical protein